MGCLCAAQRLGQPALVRFSPEPFREPQIIANFQQRLIWCAHRHGQRRQGAPAICLG